MNLITHQTLIGDSLIRKLTPKELSVPDRVITIQSLPGKTLRYVCSELEKNHLNHLFFPVDVVTYILGTNDLLRTTAAISFARIRDLINMTREKYPGIRIQVFKVPLHSDTLVSAEPNPLQEKIQEYNSLLESLQSLPGVQIIEFDFTADMLQQDDLHPNLNGIHHNAHCIRSH